MLKIHTVPSQMPEIASSISQSSISSNNIEIRIHWKCQYTVREVFHLQNISLVLKVDLTPNFQVSDLFLFNDVANVVIESDGP